MSLTTRYCWALFSLLLLAGSSCMSSQKKTNWEPNFHKESKEPYGTYLAYEGMQQLFRVEPTILKSTSSLTNLGYKLRKQKGTAFLFFIGNSFQPGEKAVDSLLALVAQGHQVMVAAQYFSDYFTHRLGIYTSANFTKNTDTLAIVHLQKEEETLSFKHDSYNYDLLQHFKNIDGNPGYLIMGTNEYQNPNFVLFQIGKGHLWVHCSPAVFSNYFLLREGNQQYLETVMSQVSAPVSKVYWSDFKHFSESHSDWSVLWNAKATRIALLLAILGIIIYIAFEVKRKQKMIPIIPPVENASVAFVETIGRLYYNKKNHSNLAEKMAQHFLEYIRQQYYLNTSNMDLEFIQQLSARSGKPLDLTQALIYQVKAAQAGKISKEQDLFSFYSQIQQFTHGRK